MKFINDEIAKEYSNWLISSDNPGFTGKEKYSQYDYYFNRLIEKAVELRLVNASDIVVTDINWLNQFQSIYKSSNNLQESDKSIGNGGGIASLKKFIAFINYKNSISNSSKVEIKELFREYLADCGKCNSRDGKGPNMASLDEYWRALFREKRINTFEYEDDVIFEEIKNKSGLYNEGDLKQGAKWYSKFLSETKFKKLLEWFVNQIRINNEIVPGKKTAGKGYNGNSIRNLYEKYRSFVGFDLDCTVQGGYMSNIPGSNYIHLTGSWLNINPIFNSKNDVVELKINYKPDNKVERDYPSKTLNELGLYDNRFPNETLRSFFEDYKKEIDTIQKGINVITPKEVGKDKTMEGNEKLNNELNLILYGPPGTGKTYNTVPRAMSIINNEPLNVWAEKYKNNKQEVLSQFRAEIEKSEFNHIISRTEKTGQIGFVTFHQSYGYEEFIEGIKPDLANRDLKYKLVDGIFKEFCNRAKKEENKDKKYVFIIDEINRGNVSKIFGELITLIEPTKRLGAEEEMKCTLPYSGMPFGVPKNVYILGTMNTADRSLVQLDAALRRRFAFEEMMPDYDVIRDNVGNNGVVAGIDIAELLRAINERIIVRLDREHQIGHSYFMKLNNDSTVSDVAKIFSKNIIPLLQEYFFDDYNLIKEVLKNNFVVEKKSEYDKDKVFYVIDVSGATKDNFTSIYEVSYTSKQDSETTEE